MANFKLTISDVKGKSITKELKEGDANPLMGLVVGAETDAAIAVSYTHLTLPTILLV